MSGKELMHRRHCLGLSVADLARHFYVLPQTIYRWERTGPPRGLSSLGADLVLRRLESDQRHGRPLE